jgi:WXG100 family type VII secretion target
MAAETVSIDYEQMRQIRSEFDDECTKMDRVYSRINEQLETLRGGEWASDAASKYYQEMDNEILIALTKLIRALNRSAEISNAIIAELEAAEEEASNMIPKQF